MRAKPYIIILLMSVQCIFAQTVEADSIYRKEINATRTTADIKIDGIADEAEWQHAESAEHFVERNPQNGKAEAKEYATKIKILYDNTGVYFFAEMNDPNPSEIKKELVERDNTGNDDWLGITINGYNDKQQGAFFIIQASGVQADAKIFFDANDDFSWNAIWYSAVKITDKGWNAEVKIPYSELRFPQKNEQLWGLNFMRIIQKTNQNLTWNFVDSKKANYMYYDGKLHGITDVKTPTRLSFLPYFSTYLNNYDGKTTLNANGGMDLKYGLTTLSL